MTAASIPSDLRAQVTGSSFYAGMRMLPKAEREAMYSVYAFCRAVDDIADDHLGDRGSRAQALERWRDAIDAIYRGEDAGEASFLREAVQRFDLARADFFAVIDGMMMDVEQDIRWPSADRLELYCDRVACAVGRLSVRIFGMEREPGEALAHHLGHALQLTNILRDLDEDAAIGRVYLSAEVLSAAGIPLTTPEEVLRNPRIDVAARSLARAAHGHFAKAHAILTAQPRGHLLAPTLMEAVYSKLLARMEATGWLPPRHRIRLSRLALLATALRTIILP